MGVDAEYGSVVAVVPWLRAGAAALLWACAAAAAEEPKQANVDIGEVRILLPPPAGQVEIKAATTRRIIEAITPAESRHLTSFAPEADAERVIGGSQPSRWASVQTVRELENRPFLESDFLQVRSGMLAAWNDEIGEMTDLVSEELVKGSERVKETMNVDMEFAASGIVPVEIVVDEPDAFSTMQLMRGEVKVRQQVIETKQVLTTTMMRVADRLVALYYYVAHKSDDDIAAARDATRAWIAAIRAANAP